MLNELIKLQQKVWTGLACAECNHNTASPRKVRCYRYTDHGYSKLVSELASLCLCAVYENTMPKKGQGSFQNDEQDQWVMFLPGIVIIYNQLSLR